MPGEGIPDTVPPPPIFRPFPDCPILSGLSRIPGESLQVRSIACSVGSCRALSGPVGAIRPCRVLSGLNGGPLRRAGGFPAYFPIVSSTM